MTDQWVPLSARGKTQEKFTSLYEGVPSHLSGSLAEWLRRLLFRTPEEQVRIKQFVVPGLRVDVLQSFERRVRTTVLWKDTDDETWAGILHECIHSPDYALDMVDFLLQFALRKQSEREALDLADMLTEAGSAWAVKETTTELLPGSSIKGYKYELERRVLEPIATASRMVMTSSGRAGQHLDEAWRLAYSRHPNPNGAFLEAVMAVEAAMVPIVTPNDQKATLGRMINAMKDQRDKLLVDMSPEANSVDPFTVVHSMCQLMWKAQSERHGTPEERERSSVSQKSAEGAVHLATTLVQWFTSGVVRRK